MSSQSANAPALSAVIPITDSRYDDIDEVFFAYKRGVEATGLEYEFIYVLDGNYPEIFAKLKSLKDQGERISIVKFAHWFGESQALSTGFDTASGSILLSLPAFFQVDPGSIPALVSALDDCDMVVARRFPRKVALLKSLQTVTFHFLLRSLLGAPFKDLGCSARAIRRSVVDEVKIYGDLHRFLPLMAHRQGFKIREMDVRTSDRNSSPLFYRFGIYIRRMLDLLSVFFVIKFTKKPLRFFGLLGTALFGTGTVIAGVLFVQRMFFQMPLADRPILLVPALLLSLGIQMFTIGLVGEIIIFTHARDLKEYHVEEILN